MAPPKIMKPYHKLNVRERKSLKRENKFKRKIVAIAIKADPDSLKPLLSPDK